MTVAENELPVIQGWFGRVRRAGLVLPSGWFGRPHDNLHALTWSAARKHKLLLELDEQLLLILTEPGPVEIDESELRVTRCAQVTLDWQEYGNMAPRVFTEGWGTVRFVPPIGAARR